MCVCVAVDVYCDDFDCDDCLCVECAGESYGDVVDCGCADCAVVKRVYERLIVYCDEC